MHSVNLSGAGWAKRLLAHGMHFLSDREKWGQIFGGLVNFAVPILAPIWTPIIDGQYYVIFAERITDAQFDR
ncbi:hypothetical protein [Paraburkholderia saeva]|uniref:hypothetical protein n=1 Tax=Paraburkholderia saeva TaxID=2777537 RepID=UPI001D2AE6C7|nr:hypothetical protein [Paraburkholderia saeva]CAG4885857.1 hypothetical protein R70241_00071 [Paraburkholderia saeva]